MLGLSLPKILFTILVVVAVWYGFKWVNRLQDQRGRKKSVSPKHAKAQDTDYEDLTACKTCGDFGLAVGRPACGRVGCPFGK